jgi:hypothetical protein
MKALPSLTILRPVPVVPLALRLPSKETLARGNPSGINPHFWRKIARDDLRNSPGLMKMRRKTMFHEELAIPPINLRNLRRLRGFLEENAKFSGFQSPKSFRRQVLP